MSSKEIWPNFFIVGAMKAGTTSMYEYLKQVPEIYVPEVKEPHYFAYDLPPYIKTYKRDEYLHLFKDVTTEKAVGEASVLYLWKPDTPRRIHEVVPNAKIIIILRDPIERAYSQYFFELNNGFHELSFHDAIGELKIRMKGAEKKFPNFIDQSFYYDSVMRYLNIFGKGNVKLIIFEEFSKNEKETVKEVLNFLGLKDDTSNLIIEKHNPTVAQRSSFSEFIVKHTTLQKIAKKILPPRLKDYLLYKFVFEEIEEKPPINQGDKLFLYGLYHKDIEQLENMLGRKLPWFKDVII